jgi:hypothetical protein
VAAERPQPAVQLAAELEHLPGVRGKRLLLPGVGDSAQHRDQRGRRGDQHLGSHCVLQQLRVALEGRGQEGITGHEQHHELRRRLERAPVLLRGQTLHVLAQVPGVRQHPALDDVGVA